MCHSSAYILAREHPSLQWLYLAVSSINLARAFDLASEVQLVESTCICRISDNQNAIFRIFANYLDWDLSKRTCQSTIDIKQDVETMIVLAHKYVIEGKLDESLQTLKQNLYMCSLCEKEGRYIPLIQTLGFLIYFLLLFFKSHYYFFFVSYFGIFTDSSKEMERGIVHF